MNEAALALIDILAPRGGRKKKVLVMEKLD
jgi:hypothetical protein